MCVRHTLTIGCYGDDIGELCTNHGTLQGGGGVWREGGCDAVREGVGVGCEKSTKWASIPATLYLL